MSLTKATYSMITGTPINVKDYGAVGDGIADDWNAIQAVFDLAPVYASATELEAKKHAISIYFPPGVYRVTNALTLGATTKSMSYVTLKMNSAYIRSEYVGASSPLTIYYPRYCSFEGLSISNPTVQTALELKIINSYVTSYSNTLVGSIHCTGMHFNNVWTNTTIGNGADGGSRPFQWYWDCQGTIYPPAVFAGGPINLFNGFHVSGGPNSMYWNGGSEITITNIEHEGFTNIGTGCAQFYNIAHLSISEIYQESFTVGSNAMYFEGCSQISLKNIKNGSYYNYTGFKNCTGVSILNMESSIIKYEGTCTDFDITNWVVNTGLVQESFTRVGAGTFNRLQLKNLTCYDVTGVTPTGQVPLITTGQLNQSDNWIINPRALDASGDVVTLYCTCVNNGAYQTISPLGFIESVVEIDAITNFAQIQVNFNTVKIAGAKTSKAVVATAFKAIVPAGFTSTSGSGITGGVTPLLGGGVYGLLTFFIGDWVITYTAVDVDSANTKVDLVWNYDTIYPIGTKFLFGGALMYSGSDIKYPLIT